MNLIEPLRFQRADIGKCDQFFTVKNGVKTELYPAGAGDKFPDCFNESIITNVHYHGTHTNPQSSGDNVFLMIKPSPRSANTARTPAVDANSVSIPFSKFFERCEAELPAPRNVPKLWPKLWRDAPKEFTDWADNTVMPSRTAPGRRTTSARCRTASPFRSTRYRRGRRRRPRARCRRTPGAPARRKWT